MKSVHSFLLALVGLIATVPQSAIAQAQPYPTRPITLIVPWPASGAQDALGRLLGPRLADRLGKPVVIENRPGAASVIGVAAAARAAPDGHTLVQAGAAFAINASVFKKLPYDPMRDFAPIALVAQVPFVMAVHTGLPANSVTEFIALAKQRPGRLSYASAGPGSPHHLYGELFKEMTGVQLVHIPYNRGVPVADVVAGHVPVLFNSASLTVPLVREGKLRALGVTTAARLPDAPEIPTIAEAGVPGFDAASWIMIVAPANTPKDIVARLHAEIKQIFRLPEIEEQLVKAGMVPIDSPPPADLQRFIEAEILRWGKVAQQAGIAGSE